MKREVKKTQLSFPSMWDCDECDKADLCDFAYVLKQHSVCLL